MAVTKNTKAFVSADTQQWLEADIASNDILDVFGSLGHAARTVVIETGTGAVIVSFNVVQKVHKYEVFNQTRNILANPVETEEARPQITLSANTVYSWENEFAIFDIKVIQTSPGMKILVS